MLLLALFSFVIFFFLSFFFFYSLLFSFFHIVSLFITYNITAQLRDAIHSAQETVLRTTLTPRVGCGVSFRDVNVQTMIQSVQRSGTIVAPADVHLAPLIMQEVADDESSADDDERIAEENGKDVDDFHAYMKTEKTERQQVQVETDDSKKE